VKKNTRFKLAVQPKKTKTAGKHETKQMQPKSGFAKT